jgi:hypothetical protein
MLHHRLPRAPFAAAALAALAACGGDDGFGADRLTPDQVSAVYEICELRFQPEGGSPPALDIRAATMEPLAQDPPVLRVARTTREFELEFTRRGDVVRPRFSGTYTTGASQVYLAFTQGSVDDELLLPSAVQLDFTDAPRTLWISNQHGQHAVSKADYEALAGQAYPNATSTIRGVLSGRFSAGGC